MTAQAWVQKLDTYL
jgi:hypothetical protein